jgi:glycosyltransferase involved in cell wall biosynthesis
MKIIFCWSDISGYMAACWRELAMRPGVDLHVIAYGDSRDTRFGGELMDGISWTPLNASQRTDAGFIRAMVEKLQPDVVVIAGWLNPAYVALTAADSLQRVSFLMGMDTPWKDTLRQRLARFALRRYLGRLSGVFVPGERAWQYARRLGIPGSRIHRGMYGVDWEGLGASAAARSQAPWPRRFLFAGRYAEEKGVDTLIEAYRLYRSATSDPWELHVCGMGDLAPRFKGEAGVTDHGFLQPDAARQLMARSGALVLASRYDPWPLIVVEAAAAGLPLIASEACGSTVELLRPEFNGLTLSADANPRELAAAMRRLADRKDLADWGARSRLLAEPYAARHWAYRWLAVLAGISQETPS